MTLVADIRRVMLEKGVAQAELARTLGMSPSQLSAILRDENYNFTVRMLRRFAAALGTDLRIVIGEEQEAEATEVPWEPLITYPTVSPGLVVSPIPAVYPTVYTSGDSSVTMTITDEGATWVEGLLGSDPSDD